MAVFVSKDTVGGPGRARPCPGRQKSPVRTGRPQRGVCWLKWGCHPRWAGEGGRPVEALHPRGEGDSMSGWREPRKPGSQGAATACPLCAGAVPAPPHPRRVHPCGSLLSIPLGHRASIQPATHVCRVPTSCGFRGQGDPGDSAASCPPRGRSQQTDNPNPGLWELWWSPPPVPFPGGRFWKSIHTSKGITG